MKLAVNFLLSAVFLSLPGIPQHTISLIPQPVNVVQHEGCFEISPDTRIAVFDSQWYELARYASSELGRWLGFEISVQKLSHAESQKDVIVLQQEKPYSPEIGPEGYLLVVNPETIRISANTREGIIYGIQTLTQLLSTDIQSGRKKCIPCCRITDYPRFSYRGLHLDVSRHFMPVDFIYNLLDYMVMHKLNVFHWHLVDDQGWRIEIKKYPRLTSVGAWRPDLEHLHWQQRQPENHQATGLYGGYYTQEEVRKVVQYARERAITIIPEIEMPAHVMSALAAYPQFSCTGKNLGVPPGSVWPITHIYCAGNDSTFIFLQDILLEVMDLFPGTYIHIGGDEADKTEWKKCSRCQSRIVAEGLKNEEELQSYFIKRIEKFLNAHGRILIGWDEILEGGLPSNAVVMSWRGETGGIEAARMGHQVIMTPVEYCYFDYYQGDPALEPLAIGGYTTLKKVYEYEPIPSVLNEQERRRVLGAQANVWTEYMPDPKHVEYMIFPRLAALCEVLWSPVEHRSWPSFSRRLYDQFTRYDHLGIRYALSAFQVKEVAEVIPEKGLIEVELHTEAPYGEIRYTTNGQDPSANSEIYKQKLLIDRSAVLKAAVFDKRKQLGPMLERRYDFHKAFLKNIQLKFPNSSRYEGKGQFGLTDGQRGTNYYRHPQWKGFLKDDAIITIDLGQVTPVKRIAVDALQQSAAWIFFPEKVTFEISEDSKNWMTVDTVLNQIPWDDYNHQIQLFTTDYFRGMARYVRVHLKNMATCPEGHPAQGKPAWLFVSEVMVE